MQSGIYLIINLVTDKIYVGSAIDFDERWRIHLLHLNRGTHHSILLQRAWDKYGAHNFLFVIVEEVEVNKLQEIEQIWLDKTDCCNPEIGYNIAPIAGSMRGVKHTDEARKNMSEAHIGNKHSEETRRKMSLAKIGNTINIGRKQTPERIEQRVSQLRNIKRPQHVIDAVIAFHIGRKRSEESKARMSASAKRRWIRADKDRMWAW